MAKSGHAGKSPSMIATIILVLGLLMATLGTTGPSLSLSLSLSLIDTCLESFLQPQSNAFMS